MSCISRAIHAVKGNAMVFSRDYRLTDDDRRLSACLHHRCRAASHHSAATSALRELRSVCSRWMFAAKPVEQLQMCVGNNVDLTA